MPTDELKAYINDMVEGRRPSVVRQLTAEQRAKVYYTIIDASGCDSVTVVSKIAVLIGSLRLLG